VIPLDPTTARTVQHFREAMDNRQSYRFLILNQDGIHSR
jgi:hypothetical protein